MGIETEVRDSHWQNADSPKEVKVLGRVTEAKDRQLKKALLSMEVTPSGIIIEANDLQSQKALLPIEVRALGSETEDRDSQPLKADSLIALTFSGIVTVFSLEHPSNNPPSIETRLAGRAIFSKDAHRAKVHPSIV